MIICKHLYRLKVYVNRSSEVSHFICPGECWDRVVAGTLLLICHIGVAFISHFRNWTMIKADFFFATFIWGESGVCVWLFPVESCTWESRQRTSTDTGVWVFPSCRSWRFASRWFVPLNYKPKTDHFHWAESSISITWIIRIVVQLNKTVETTRDL